MKQWRPLRVLIVGRQSRFGRILATNVQSWGHIVVKCPDVRSLCEEGKILAHDVLLYDLDESFHTPIPGNDATVVYRDIPVADFLKSSDGARYLHNRLTIVCSSHSVSRATLEQIGAIALLQKPFHVGRLQRYLRVLQHLVSVQDHEEASPETRSGIIRVLVVDDDEDVAHAVAQCLIYEPGYQVAVAYDGLDALEKFVHWRPQCIVTDLIMPWMNGYQVMRCLAHSPLRRLPAFVIMSALTQREVSLSCLYPGGVAVYVDKPFHIDCLLDAIKVTCT